MTVVRGVRRAGERAVVLDVDAPPAGVAAAVRSLVAGAGIAVSEVVPGAATVLVVTTDAKNVSALLASLAGINGHLTDQSPATAGEPIEIPVRYDGPDLPEIAANTGLSTDEIIRRHTAVTYEAAFTGFAPGFAYLTGLDAGLQLPRRSTPRSSVPAGSLAIADVYTAVYPRSSPGGWHLIGTTDLELFDVTRDPPARISPGDHVRFTPL